jgi:hypothetical protein
MKSADMYPDPSLDDQRRTLLTFYFGRSDPLVACVSRAYRDFNRTLHGLSGIANRDALKNAAEARVRGLLSNLAHNVGEPSKASFDSWHRAGVTALQELYAGHDYKKFTVGQGQKWLNMAFKYLQCYGDEEVAGFGRWYPFAHVPIDNDLLGLLEDRNPPRLGARWSRLNDYETYLGFQEWFRKEFAGSSPLAVESWMWREG